MTVPDAVGNWPVYTTMPVIAALIGYLTKRAALEMMFRPLEFVGVKPFLGWQGVIPRNAHRMASVAMKLMTTTVIQPKEVFARLDPKTVTEQLREPLARAEEQITHEVMTRYQPNTCAVLPEHARQRLINMVNAQAPMLVEKLMREVSQNIADILDVTDLAVTNLVRDKAVLNTLIRDTTKPEMRFIAHSGIYFGFVIGLVQVVTWTLTHSPWIMPIFGGLVGWLTDWLALKMIFFPRAPKRFFGLFTWQGMVQRRKSEVARDYGDVIAREILTVPKVMAAILTGPKSDRLYAMIQQEIQRYIDAQAGFAKPLVVAAVGSRRYQQMKQTAARRAVELLPETARHMEQYAAEALDVRNTIVRQIQLMTPIQYEGLLRPAFKQDEWKLIAVGATIGFLVGELQVLLMQALRLGG